MPAPDSPAALTTLHSDPGPAPKVWRGYSLTLLLHPDLARVGEVARLPELSAALPVELSRMRPAFGPARRALNHPRISRAPVWLEPVEAGVRLSCGDTRSRVDGVEPTSDLVIPRARIEDEGVFIELGGCVLLWLHHGELPTMPPDPLGLHGVSAALAALRAEISLLAAAPLNLLIVGESGVGKERVARALHRLSPRAAGPFVAFNLAGMRSEAAAELLFSPEGAIAQARGGTLLLDEVGAAEEQVQLQLLRVLDASERPAQGEPRVLSSTHGDPRDGRIRPALYHRLRGAELTVPPLRRRRADIPLIFLENLRLELVRVGAPELLSAAALDGKPWLGSGLAFALTLHPLPGNSRELQHIAIEVVARCRALPRASLPAPLGEQLSPPASPKVESLVGAEDLRRTLAQNRWRIGPTAEALGIAKNTVIRLIRGDPTLRLAGDLSDEEIRAALQLSGGDVADAALRRRVSAHGLKLRIQALSAAADGEPATPNPSGELAD